MREVEVLVIGAGPAGMTAALQLKRSGIDPYLVEKDRLGGALLNAGNVENYPGVMQGTPGSELAQLFHDHLNAFGIEVHRSAVNGLTRDGVHFVARCSDDEIRARAVVVATGCVPIRLNIPGEIEHSGKTVFHELRDLPSDLGAKACVIGGGDVAFDYALSLAARNFKVQIILRSHWPRCLARLYRSALASGKINILPDHEPKELKKNGASLEVVFKDTSKPPVVCDFALVAVGRTPDTRFISPDLLQGNAKLPLYFAGDVVNGSYRQVGIAVGDGLRCAMEIARYFDGKRCFGNPFSPGS